MKKNNKSNVLDLMNKIPGRILSFIATILMVAVITNPGMAQDDIPTEADYYEIVDIPISEDIFLEVGGMDVMPDGSLAVCTRRGEVWIIENPSQVNGEEPEYRLFAEGLHEPLGLTYRDGAIYVTQRPEITRLEDTDGDGRADEYKTVWDRPLSGNYHEYFYGPLFTPEGNMLVTVNLAWIGYGESLSKWDGWLLEVTPEGEVTPIATGLRSPAAFAYNADGEIFYAENQGDWVGSGNITHLEKGDFAGNPRGLRWSSEPGSPLSLKIEDVPDTGAPMHEVAKDLPELKTPSVWFPHGVMGISTSGILLDNAEIDFGPFENQLFVGDQGQSKVMRVFQEKVKGEYQGVVFPFREGFESGVLRMNWGQDNSMYVGMTSRGWSSTGPDLYGLQQLVWNGEIPFEIKEVHAQPDGFELTFTKSVNPETAGDPSSYEITGFTYHYHSTYGSDIINQENAPVTHVEVADDGLSARLVVDNIREGYIHEIKADGVTEAETGYPLVHSVGYYTMKNIPEGEPLAVSTESTQAGSKDEDADESGFDSQKHQTTQPASWDGGADKVITINAEDAMTFDVTNFEVEAGSKVRLIFNNPTDLLHNLLIVQQGQLESVAQNALNMGLQGPQRGYVPDSDEVLYHTSLLEVGESESIFFTAPEQPDEYPYVCTFPGHWQTMQGVMTVTE
ncbi:plastocyanin/azurin family copper-binding protein [Aliifodinibius sp. S!AR15-10]|uniref:plastocyanin/azurin family copper-binding protein n=1 Tax=Aliifodinibius sp. S!AR15-10 TaxID=2950437 RepID=UPI00285BBC2A|nr:plastocyanin/azurin family copper-binding protein [Aliifodinibius sp. S!AR15-10]MDR8391858.1 plastocyanin/azurin family copper-binding protein [Aliifodinibius sp. S!AR15-10]